MLRFCLSLLLLLPVFATDPGKTVVFGRGYETTPLPAFDKGYLLFTLGRSAVEVWGPDGQRRFVATVENPPGARVLSPAVDSDGTVAAGIGFRGPQVAGGGIVYFDRTGKQTRFVDTGRYMPAHVCFDRNHSLWTFGWQRDDSGDHEEKLDYLMFRKYSADGSEAGRYGPRSSLPDGGLTPGGAYGGYWRIRVADDRVGARANGQTAENQVWIELGLDGHLIGQWPLGRDPHRGLAFTSDARLCRQASGDMSRFECFDRGAGAWKDAGVTSMRGMLLGAQQDEFVFGREEGVLRLMWAKVP